MIVKVLCIRHIYAVNNGLFGHHDLRGPGHLDLCGVAHSAFPSIFVSPISSSSFAHLCVVPVRIPAIDDDDSPAAAISIHGECYCDAWSDTALYSPVICTSAPDKDATSSLDKTKHPRQYQELCKHMFQVLQPLQAEQQSCMAGD
jgi:hypothetical protein